MSYKEFYFWLSGYLTNRNWTEIHQEDIETIIEKMGEVKEGDVIPIELIKRRAEFHNQELRSLVKIDPLPHAPRIICEKDDKKDNTLL